MSTLITDPDVAALRRPRLGFLGAGWIGLHRLKALHDSGAGTVAAVADPVAERVRAAQHAVPTAAAAASLEDLLELELDGIVIATPSSLHAEQSIRALDRGLTVFCQKPLARTAAETARVTAAARAADRLLGVDLSYRHTAALRALRDAVRGGATGPVYAIDLVFHNAYGPGDGWARDPALAGGGCVIDLGIHLVDMALWSLEFPAVRDVSGQLYAHGRRLAPASGECEDFATATIELDGGTTVRLACSWEANCGRGAVMEATFRGATATAAMRNVDGSFHDFVAELHEGTATRVLAEPPDDWGGRALVEWSRRLGMDASYDPAIETVVTVATVLDGVLGR